MPYVALEAITIQSLNMILANNEAQTRPYQYYVTVCLSYYIVLSSFDRPQSSRFSSVFV